MANARAAEWIFARLTNPERAAEIVGDLLEQRAGTIIFVVAVMRIAFAAGWRWAIAVGVAGFSFVPTVGLFMHVVSRHRTYSQTLEGFTVIAPQPWLPWSIDLMWAAIFMLATAMLALVRFGLRDRLSQVATGLSVLVLVSACTLWVPHARVFVTALFLINFTVLLTVPVLRRSLACLVTGCVAAFLPMYMIQRLLHMMHATMPVRTGTMVSFWLCALILEATVLTRMHRRLLRIETGKEDADQAVA